MGYQDLIALRLFTSSCKSLMWPYEAQFRRHAYAVPAYFQWSLISGGLIIGRNFAFLNGFGLKIKTVLIKTLQKQPKTASTNSPWAYIQEGLLSEGFLRLRFVGAYFREGLFFIYLFFFFFWGGGLLSEFYGMYFGWIVFPWVELLFGFRKS